VKLVTPSQRQAPSAAPVPFRIRGAEGQPVARAVRIGSHPPAGRVERAVEEHPLDPLMIMEAFDVPQVAHCRPHVRVQVGRAVPQDLQVMRDGEGRCA
jgi:hypothetical protein